MLGGPKQQPFGLFPGLGAGPRMCFLGMQATFLCSLQETQQPVSSLAFLHWPFVPGTHFLAVLSEVWHIVWFFPQHLSATCALAGVGCESGPCASEFSRGCVLCSLKIPPWSVQELVFGEWIMAFTVITLFGAGFLPQQHASIPHQWLERPTLLPEDTLVT